MPNENITLVATPAQFRAIRKLSLKYKDVSPQQMADKLFAQVVRNYFKTEAKAIADRSAAMWDMSVEGGFAPPQERKEYIAASVKEANEILRELKGNDNPFD